MKGSRCRQWIGLAHIQAARDFQIDIYSKFEVQTRVIIKYEWLKKSYGKAELESLV